MGRFGRANEQAAGFEDPQDQVEFETEYGKIDQKKEAEEHAQDSEKPRTQKSEKKPKFQNHVEPQISEVIRTVRRPVPRGVQGKTKKPSADDVPKSQIPQTNIFERHAPNDQARPEMGEDAQRETTAVFGEHSPEQPQEQEHPRADDPQEPGHFRGISEKLAQSRQFQGGRVTGLINSCDTSS